MYNKYLIDRGILGDEEMLAVEQSATRDSAKVTAMDVIPLELMCPPGNCILRSARAHQFEWVEVHQTHFDNILGIAY